MSFTDLNDFLRESNCRFATTGKALDRLSRLGMPQAGPVDPSAFLLNAESPSSNNWTFLHILGALLYDLDHSLHRSQSLILRQIKRHWLYIHPWTTYLLDAVTTSKVTATQKGYEIVECVLHIVPLVVQYPTRFPPAQQETEITTLIESSPKLRDSTRRVWVMIVADHHPLWQLWTQLAAMVFRAKTFDIRIDDRDANQLHSGCPGRSLSMALTRHTIREIPCISSMTDKDVMHLVDLHVLWSNETVIPGNPVVMCPIPRYTLRIQARLISKALRKRQKVLFASADGGILSMALNSLVTVNLAQVFQVLEGRGRWWITEFLDTDVLVNFFKADMLDIDSIGSGILSAGIGIYLAKTLDLVSRNLVYPMVLHAFLKTVRKLEHAGVEGRRQQECWWSSWVRCKRKAFVLKGIRRELRSEVETICSCAECPLKADSTKPCQKDLHAKHLACSRCSAASYCSRECQKWHWEKEHKSECRSLSDLIKDGTPPVTRLETRFIRRVLRAILEKNMGLIQATLRNLPPPKSQLDQHLRLARPIVAVDLDRTDSFDENDLSTRCIKIMHSVDLIVSELRLRQTKNWREWVRGLLERSQHLDEDEVAVVIFAPSHLGRSDSGPLLTEARVGIPVLGQSMERALGTEVTSRPIVRLIRVMSREAWPPLTSWRLQVSK
ncbi:hypothetical protein PM082_019599 [Marasmius tenuissimus]|nr:hypothetical protein PM082_019599 [Marasmius tenuissimus]